MAKIEVVIDDDQVPAVRDLFSQAGGTGSVAGHGPPARPLDLLQLVVDAAM